TARAALEKEAGGLENRVRNLRKQLAEHERELARLGGRPARQLSPFPFTSNPHPATLPSTCPPGPGPASPGQADRLDRLDELAGPPGGQRVGLAHRALRAGRPGPGGGVPGREAAGAAGKPARALGGAPPGRV